jgi:hypothetical protein
MVESNELADSDLLNTAFVGLERQFLELIGTFVDAEITIC